MAIHSDRALVLKRISFGESSLVAHVLTPRFGRVNLLAKGAYRTTSRYFAVLDLFDTLDLEWDAAPTRELANLRRGELATRRRALHANLASYRAGLAILEMLELVARPGASELELFTASERALDDLADGSIAPEQVLVTWELALLEHLGLAPALERCAACGRIAGALDIAPPAGRETGGASPADAGRVPANPSRARTAFSAGAGGRLCARCAREARASGRRVGTLPIAVLDDARALWHDSRTHATARASGVRALDALRLVRVRDFVERFLDYHLETQPRSHRAFLSVPNRNAPTAPERRR